MQFTLIIAGVFMYGGGITGLLSLLRGFWRSRNATAEIKEAIMDRVESVILRSTMVWGIGCFALLAIGVK